MSTDTYNWRIFTPGPIVDMEAPATVEEAKQFVIDNAPVVKEAGDRARWTRHESVRSGEEVWWCEVEDVDEVPECRYIILGVPV